MKNILFILCSLWVSLGQTSEKLMLQCGKENEIAYAKVIYHSEGYRIVAKYLTKASKLYNSLFPMTPQSSVMLISAEFQTCWTHPEILTVMDCDGLKSIQFKDTSGNLVAHEEISQIAGDSRFSQISEMTTEGLRKFTQLNLNVTINKRNSEINFKFYESDFLTGCFAGKP